MMTYGEASEIAPTDRMIGSLSEFADNENKRTEITKMMGRI